jgi:outer membrane protein assembly factor BamB
LSAGSTWSSYLGPNGNGTAEGQIPLKVQKEGPKILWKAEIGRGCSSFAVVDGKALTVGNKDDQDTLWCFDAATGKVRWKQSYDEKLAPKFYDGGPGATPIVEDGLVYNLSKSGRFSCHDLQTGAEKWVVHFVDDFEGNKPTWGYSSSPVVYGDVLLCLPCAKGGSMVALDKKTGKERWRSTHTARPGYSAPVLCKYDGRDAAVVFHGRSLVGYDLSAKGKVLYEFTWRTPYDVNASNPQVLGDLIYLSSGYGMGYAVIDVSGEKPTMVHRNRELPMIFQNAFVEDGDVIGCFGDKRYEAELYRMDFKTGQIYWRHPIPGSRGSTARIGDTTVALSETGMVVFGKAGKEQFTETGRHQILKELCWAPLAIGEGRLFARTNQGEMVCADLTD